MLLEKIIKLRQDAEYCAFVHYIRKGRAPRELADVVGLARAIEEYFKYNPNWQDQPRVPAGNPDGGQWTDGGGGGEDGTGDEGGGSGSGIAVDELIDSSALILSFLPAGRVALSVRRFIQALRAGRRGAAWTLGRHKSPKKWSNRLVGRDWTYDEITHILKTGKKFPAPNKVNPGNKAVRYQDKKTGRFVVRDEVTKEILQVSGRRYKPEKPVGE